MCKYKITLSIFLLFLLCVTHGNLNQRKRKRHRSPSTSSKFDILIFTQRWPPTVCFTWKENSESHVCTLPKHDEWTIHGIWPTQYHTTGPEYCNKSLPFDIDALAPIESELKENWIDIRNGSNPSSFWKHEWNKHGTCAVTIEALNSQVKYFQTGLKLLESYNMIDVLAKANITPGGRYMIQNILEAIKKVLGKTVQVECVKNEKTGESYVFEIRICFNKALQLIDCDGIYDFPTNCNRLEQIIYPGHVPHKYRVVQI